MPLPPKAIFVSSAPRDALAVVISRSAASNSPEGDAARVLQPAVAADAALHGTRAEPDSGLHEPGRLDARRMGTLGSRTFRRAPSILRCLLFAWGLTSKRLSSCALERARDDRHVGVLATLGLLK